MIWCDDHVVGTASDGSLPESKREVFFVAVPDLAIIVVKVIKVKTFRGYSFVDFPPQDYDTACDRAGKVFVKFQDHEFLPIHVVFFDRPNAHLAEQYFKNFQRLHWVKYYLVGEMRVACTSNPSCSSNTVHSLWMTT